MNKSVEELTAEVIVAVINANPAWVYHNKGDEVDTAPLVKLIKDVHETFTSLQQTNFS